MRDRQNPQQQDEWEDVGQGYGRIGESYRGGFGAGGGGMGDLSRERKGPKGYTRSDERIREMLCERLTHEEDLEVSDVSVDVKDGKVTLEGTVPDRYMKHHIEDLADSCWGVKDVENRLRVGQSEGSAGSSSESSAGGAMHASGGAMGASDRSGSPLGTQGGNRAGKASGGGTTS